MAVPIASTFDPSPESDVQVLKIPAGPTASVIHKGSYENMGESYATVVAWINERGHDIVGPSREVYFNSPAEVPEAELITEILFPINTDVEA